MRFAAGLDNLYLQIALITGIVPDRPRIKWVRRNVGFINLSQLFCYHVRATGRYAPNFRRITRLPCRYPLVGDWFSSVKDRLPNSWRSYGYRPATENAVADATGLLREFELHYGAGASALVADGMAQITLMTDLQSPG